MSHYDIPKLAAAISEDDYHLTPEELDARYNPEGGGEHSVFSRADWRQQVMDEVTISGYWAWVAHMIEQVRTGDLPV